MNLAILLLVCFVCLSMVWCLYRQGEMWRVVRHIEDNQQIAIKAFNHHTHNISEIEGK